MQIPAWKSIDNELYLNKIIFMCFSNSFYQILLLILVLKFTNIVTLTFLPRTPKSSKKAIFQQCSSNLTFNSLKPKLPSYRNQSLGLAFKSVDCLFMMTILAFNELMLQNHCMFDRYYCFDLRESKCVILKSQWQISDLLLCSVSLS